MRAHVLKDLHYYISFLKRVIITLSARMLASTPATSWACFTIRWLCRPVSSLIKFHAAPERALCLSYTQATMRTPNSIGCIMWWKMWYMNAVATTLKMNGVICAHIIRQMVHPNVFTAIFSREVVKSSNDKRGRCWAPAELWTEWKGIITFFPKTIPTQPIPRSHLLLFAGSSED